MAEKNKKINKANKEYPTLVVETSHKIKSYKTY